MKNKLLPLLILISFTIFFSSCSGKKEDNNRIVIALAADAQSLNPLFSFSFQEVNISELLYLGLIQHEWNDSVGVIVSSHMIAKNWEWNIDSSSLVINLRDDVKWRDDKSLTAEDVVFSFDLYSDPDVQSRFYGTFSNFITDTNLHIELGKTFEVKDRYTLQINFKPGCNPSLFDIDVPIIPKHIFEKIARKDLITLEKGNDTVTSGPFYLYKWDKNQSIVLRRNDKSFLSEQVKPQELIFKIVTDYNGRITQLKNGDIDFAEGIKPDQVEELKGTGKIIIDAVKGREYDYAAWNNIDPLVYNSTKKRVPNKLFGSTAVRKALSYAINKDEVLTGFLGGFGDAASGPVAHIFINYYNNEVKSIEYNPEKAKELLALDGWNDLDKNGILEKNGEEFTFTLNYSSGNPRREYAATIIKNNLKSVGIDVKTQGLEQGLFFDKMFGRELQAWLGGWSVPMPLDLKPYWGSDLEKSPLNLIGYTNKEVDKLLESISLTKSEKEKIVMYRKIQQLLSDDTPVTFLYWIDNITAYNKRLKNIRVTPLGSIHRCWEWQVE